MKKPNFDFEYGDCAALAVVLHRETGRPLFAVLDFDLDLLQIVLVHAYIKIENKKFQIFDICGPSNLQSILDKYPNTEDAREVSIDERNLLEIAYLPSNMPNIDEVIPFARELIAKWPKEF